MAHFFEEEKIYYAPALPLEGLIWNPTGAEILFCEAGLWLYGTTRQLTFKRCQKQ
jgi:hypothetical protein